MARIIRRHSCHRVNFIDDTLSSDVNQAGEVICRNCPLGRMKGSDEWLGLFNREELVSPFQDGHYIYIVIPGYGSGEDVVAPKICVADGESPNTYIKSWNFKIN